MPDDQTPPATDEPAHTAIGPRIAQIALTLVILYLVFFQILPGIADWSEVWDSLQDLTVATLIVALVISLGLEALKAREQLLVVPQLGFWRAAVSVEITSLATSLVPGPSGTTARFVVYRSFGLSTADFARAWVVTSAFNNLLVLAMPAFGALAVLAFSDQEIDSIALVIGAISLVVGVTLATIGVCVLRSESFARRFGHAYGRFIRWLRGLMKKPSDKDAAAAVLHFRSDALEVLREKGAALAVTIVGKYMLSALLLWLSLRAVGVPADELNPAEVFASYTYVRLFTIVSITPGSIGIAEALYASSLTALAGPGADEATILAGVIVFRAATYALPIVLGAISWVVWQRKRSWRAEAAAEPATDAVVKATVGRKP